MTLSKSLVAPFLLVAVAKPVELTRSEMEVLEAELAKISIHGNRTDEDIASLYRNAKA